MDSVVVTKYAKNALTCMKKCIVKFQLRCYLLLLSYDWPRYHGLKNSMINNICFKKSTITAASSHLLLTTKDQSNKCLAVEDVVKSLLVTQKHCCLVQFTRALFIPTSPQFQDISHDGYEAICLIYRKEFFELVNEEMEVIPQSLVDNDNAVKANQWIEILKSS